MLWAVGFAARCLLIPYSESDAAKYQRVKFRLEWPARQVKRGNAELKTSRAALACCAVLCVDCGGGGKWVRSSALESKWMKIGTARDIHAHTNTIACCTHTHTRIYSIQWELLAAEHLRSGLLRSRSRSTSIFALPLLCPYLIKLPVCTWNLSFQLSDAAGKLCSLHIANMRR